MLIKFGEEGTVVNAKFENTLIGHLLQSQVFHVVLEKLGRAREVNSLSVCCKALHERLNDYQSHKDMVMLASMLIRTQAAVKLGRVISTQILLNELKLSGLLGISTVAEEKRLKLQKIAKQLFPKESKKRGIFYDIAYAKNKQSAERQTTIFWDLLKKVRESSLDDEEVDVLLCMTSFIMSNERYSKYKTKHLLNLVYELQHNAHPPATRAKLIIILMTHKDFTGWGTSFPQQSLRYILTTEIANDIKKAITEILDLHPKAVNRITNAHRHFIKH